LAASLIWQSALVIPRYEAIVSKWMSPIQAVELLFMLWLLIMGAKPNPDGVRNHCL
jgi:hypothetical protein